MVICDDRSDRVCIYNSTPQRRAGASRGVDDILSFEIGMDVSIIRDLLPLTTN